MTTILEYYEQLIPALVARFSISPDEIRRVMDKSTETEQEFKSFGKFTTKQKLDKGVSNALSKGKYCNVSKGIMHDDTSSMRSKYDLYSSGISGVRESDELTQALLYYPGTLVNKKESLLFSQYTAVEPASTIGVAHDINVKDTLKSQVMQRHHITKVIFIHDGMFAYNVDEQRVYGIVDMKTGTVSPLEPSHIATLETRRLRYTLSEQDEGPEDGVCEYPEIIKNVVDAIKKL